MALNAAQKAWETRRARAAAAAIASQPAKAARPKVERVSPLAGQVVQLNAAHRAHETRRALEAARQELEARRNGVTSPSPVEAELVHLYIDDSKIGCGYRQFVVVEIGPKAVRLFNAPTLQEISVDRFVFDKRATPYRTVKSRVINLITKTISCCDRLGIDYDARAAKAALAVLQ